MKIAHFESSMNWGGQELRIVEQSAWLNQHGHPTWIIARPGSKILQQAMAAQVPVFELAMRGSLHPGTFRQLKHFLRQQQIDVLDCHGSRDASYGACVKWLTDIAVARSRHVTDPIKTGGLRSIVWRHGQHAVITTAQKIKDMLIEQSLASADRIFVAPAGVDGERFRPDIDTSALKAELGIPAEHTVIANVGMIRPDKGQLFFVEAARTLLQQGRPLTFVQIGEATAQTQDYYQQVLELAGDQLNQGIRFLGYHPDVERYLALANIVVISSIATEAQTRLVGQASLMKRNLVTTTVGGLPEMITDEETGLLCPPGDADALQQAIIRLLEQPEQAATLRDAAFIRAQQEMSFQHMMDVMLDVYHFACRRAGREV